MLHGLRRILHYETLQIAVYLYALLTRTLNINKNDAFAINLIKKILQIALTIIISILLLTLAVLFAIFYEIVNLYLAYKHGDDYFGLLEGTDVIWHIENESKCVINSLFIMEVNNEHTYEDLCKFFFESYAKLCVTHPKMSCIREMCMGYCYFLKIPLDIKDHVRFLDDYDSEESFEQVMDRLSNAPLPVNNKSLWQIYIGKTPIQWKRYKNKVQYPVVIRYHHTLGDGISLLAMMTTNLNINGVELMRERCDNYRAILSKNKSRKTLWQKLYDFVMNTKLYISYCGLVCPKESNLLAREDVTAEKYICWSIEDENKNYIDKVKRIKNRFKGIGFTDVVLTAISASITEYYYKQNDQYKPDTIRAALTYYFTTSDFNKIVTLKNNQALVKLQNAFSLGVTNLPLKDDDVEKNLVQRMHAIKNEVNVLKDALDYAFVYFQLKILCTVVPVPVVTSSLRTNKCSIIVTNVPGNSKAQLLSGHMINDTVVWAPNFNTTGITFSLFTFDQLFRFGLLVDKTIIPNRKDAQILLDRIFHFIDVLDDLTKE